MTTILTWLAGSHIIQGIIVGARAGVSHGTDHYERGGESHDHDRQRVEHHLQMRPARQWHPPAGRLRQKPTRRQCGARGCLLDDDHRQCGAAALRPTRVRPAFS